jgi:hypothetical protein
MSDYEGDEYKFSRDQQRQLDKYKSQRKASSAGDLTARDGIKDWKPFNHNKRDTGAGKGDKPRPTGLSQKEYGLRYDLATGAITREEFNKAMEELQNG